MHILMSLAWLLMWSGTYSMVLIGCHRDKWSFMKHMGTVGCVFWTKGIVFICFDYVQPGLVFVHRVQDDLGVEIDFYIRSLSKIIKTDYNNSSGMTHSNVWDYHWKVDGSLEQIPHWVGLHL